MINRKNKQERLISSMIMKANNIVYIVICLLAFGCEKSENEVMSKSNIEKTDQEWKDQLSKEEYFVTREQGTERPFSGKYWDHKEIGIYSCICCDAQLFLSDTKFDSGCGWPSYFKPISSSAIIEKKDLSHGMIRTEVVCSNCDAHLGHVFSDGPPPTGLRYCINSVAIRFKPINK